MVIPTELLEAGMYTIVVATAQTTTTLRCIKL
jgi:hypothetical protein